MFTVKVVRVELHATVKIERVVLYLVILIGLFVK
jgi:hypothetical protein